MQEFRMIVGSNPKKFEQQIQELLNRGFKLHGCTCFTSRKDSDGTVRCVYNQALVKKDQEQDQENKA